MLTEKVDRLFLSYRREAIEKSRTQIGIDYIEVVPGSLAGTWRLDLYFIPSVDKNVRPATVPLTSQVAISGADGPPISSIQVLSVSNDAENALVLNVYISGDRQQLSDRGDGPTYTLALADVPSLDPFFDRVTFSLEARNFVERTSRPGAPTPPGDEPEIDYLSKDYATFRNLMLNRLSLTTKWRSSNPADMVNTIVEALAYSADLMSYYQDAVASESYLGTARLRISARRHARLLGYFIQEGCNARVWVHVSVKSDLSLPRGARLATGSELEEGAQRIAASRAHASLFRADLTPRDLAEAVSDGASVFETMLGADLYVGNNEFQIYTWGAPDFALTEGATSATLVYTDSIVLSAGDVIVFEEIRGALDGDPDPDHRHAVRLTGVQPGIDPIGRELEPHPGVREDKSVKILSIEWSSEDALPFPLVISEYQPSGYVAPLARALGNIVLADHGATVRGEHLPPVVDKQRFEPVLKQKDLTFQAPLSLDRPAASRILYQNPQEATPYVALNAHEEVWTPRRDLLESEWDTQAFVVEMESDRVAHLRFGDGVLGKRPSSGTVFTADYRSGNGTLGNVGRDTIRQFDYVQYPGIKSVRNPMPAVGGIDPESISRIVMNAPQALHTQERCVTEADYAHIAQRHPEVNQARASRRWTGMGYTVFLAVDRVGNNPVDAAFEADLTKFMHPYLLLGGAMVVTVPRYIPLEVAFNVGIQPGYYGSSVKQDLLEVFSNQRLPDGGTGFFYPGNFTFGQSVYLSQLIARALTVQGVLWVDATRFGRWHEASHRLHDRAEIIIGPTEIPRLDNNPDAPEFGQIWFTIVDTPRVTRSVLGGAV